MTKIKLLLFGVLLAAMLALPGAAMAKSHDRNHDGIPDKWEKHFGLSTKHNVAKADPDRDGLNNLGEFRSHTNPRKADTNGNGVNDANDDQDGDGISNENEMRDQTNPSQRDSNHDGIDDGNEAQGTVVSFTEDSPDSGTGTLTIQRADNTTVTGKVDSSTEIECKPADQQSGRHERDGGGDNSGAGNDGANDANDDNGADNGQNAGCSTADLTPGTVVREAELQGSGDQAVFEKVELQK
jgi:hypothetical protein